MNATAAKKAPPGPSRRRRLGLLVLGLAAGWAAAEVAIRLLWPHLANAARVHDLLESERGKFCRHDERLGWAGRPGAEDVFEWADCRVRVRQNRDGFRGPAQDLPRTGRPRVVVLGDSFVWGFGVEEDEIFTAQMARGCASPLEVVNLGVSGYGTDQEVLLWERDGRRWRPDHVLLCVTLSNDLDEIRYASAYDYAKPLFVPSAGGGLEVANVPVPRRSAAWAEPAIATKDAWKGRLPGLLRRSAVVNVTLSAASRSPALARALADAGLVPARRDDGDWELPQYEAPPPAWRRESWDLFARLVARLRDDAAAEGARPTVVAIPSVLQVDDALWARTLERNSAVAPRLDRDLPQRLLADVCRGLGVPVIDLLPALRRAAGEGPPPYFPLNLHWTPAGHRVVAATLLEELGYAPRR